jgi:hypothetical protein
MNNHDLSLLENAAAKLSTLLNDVVFVGGATLALFITDPGAAPVRTTKDVDVIAEITTYMELISFEERLREQNFLEDVSEGAPRCRWLKGDLILDVMALDGSVLGFTNRWYADAMKAAQSITLPNGATIQAITAPYFLGTKMEAFRGRGKGDFQASHDLEDFVAVIEGCPSIVEDVVAAPEELRLSLAEASTELLKEARFTDALPGYLLPDPISQQRVSIVLKRLTDISQVSERIPSDGEGRE